MNSTVFILIRIPIIFWLWIWECQRYQSSDKWTDQIVVCSEQAWFRINSRLPAHCGYFMIPFFSANAPMVSKWWKITVINWIWNNYFFKFILLKIYYKRHLKNIAEKERYMKLSITKQSIIESDMGFLTRKNRCPLISSRLWAEFWSKRQLTSAIVEGPLRLKLVFCWDKQLRWRV